MPTTITNTYSDATITRLQVIVQRHNQARGENLTVKQWMKMTMEVAAIAEELADSAAAIQKRHDEDNQAAKDRAMEAERVRLLGVIRG